MQVYSNITMHDIEKVINKAKGRGKSVLRFLLPIANAAPNMLFSVYCNELYHQALNSTDFVKMKCISDIVLWIFKKDGVPLNGPVLKSLRIIDETSEMEKIL